MSKVLSWSYQAKMSLRMINLVYDWCKQPMSSKGELQIKFEKY